MGKNQHVVPRDGGWAVRGEGNEITNSSHRTQDEAIDAARSIAKKEKTEVVIHGRDGRIRDKDSYGNEPCPPKGDTKGKSEPRAPRRHHGKECRRI